MADSDDDYESGTTMSSSHKRHGSQNGRNKFKKEREDLSVSLINGSSDSMSGHKGMFNSRDSSNKHRYNGNGNGSRRSDRSYSPPQSFRNERMPSPRRGNGYQQHSYVAGGGGGSGGGYYNPNNRYEYGSFGSNRHEEHDFSYKRSRSLYEGSGGYYNNHSSNFPHEPSYYDSNKKFRRDWSVLEGPSSNKYYEHDNRSSTQPSDLDDLSNELLPQEYNRLNRPSNYSSYNQDHHGQSNGNHGYFPPAFNHHSNMPIVNHHNHPMQNQSILGSAGGFRNQQAFPGYINNNMSYMQNQHQQQNMMPPMQQQVPAFNSNLLSNDRFFNNDYDGQTQPQMLSFKQFMAGLQAESNEPISQELATKRYNDYKNSFRREQITLFYGVHKNEDWFKCRYHPDDSAKRKDEQREAIKRRLKLFFGLIEKYCTKNESNNYFDLSLDMTQEKDRQNMHKFIDACIIKLEDGTDADLDILEKIYTNESLVDSDQDQTKPDSDKTDCKPEDESVKAEPTEKHKLSDDESGMGSNDNSDDEDDDEDEEGLVETVKTADSKFDRKKKSKRKKNINVAEKSTEQEPNPDSAIKPTATKEKVDELENKDNSDNSKPRSSKDETMSSVSKLTINNMNQEKKVITIPHKTQSIFFKHLPVNVTRQDLEEIGKKFAGFKRASISEPAPERRFQRRGWITYDSSIDIKEVCSKINGLKLHEMLLNATINREIDQKIKCIIGLTNDKKIVRTDLKLIAKVVDNMDKRWGLWQYVDCYSNNKLNDDDFKLSCDKKKSKENSKKKTNADEENPEKPVDKDEVIESNNEVVEKNAEIVVEAEASVMSKNPLVEEANEYLKYLSEQNEEATLKDENGNTAPTNGNAHSPKDEPIKKETEETSVDYNQKNGKKEDEKTNEIDSKSKSSMIILNKTFKLEKDEKAAKLLDKLIVYLRIVHSIDYYNATEYQQEDWMPNRCGILHARGSSEPKSSNQPAIVNILSGVNINHFDPNAIKKVQIDEWLRLFEINIKSYVDYRERIDLEIARRLGLKDLSNEIEKFITSNCQKVEKDIWLCPLSGKKFKGPDYVRKHIETKHRERLLELRKDVEYFNRFVLDPKRPYLPEHPLTKNMMNPQQQQLGISYPDYYSNNMYPMQNSSFNQFQAPGPFLNPNLFNGQQKTSNQFNQYQTYHNNQQHHSNNYNNNYMPPNAHKARR